MGPLAAALSRHIDGIIGWVEQRNEAAVLDRQHGVHRDETVAHDFVAMSLATCPWHCVLDRDDNFEVGECRVWTIYRTPNEAGHGLTMSHEAADGCPVRSFYDLVLRGAAEREWRCIF